jgi:hypothetical protein
MSGCRYWAAELLWVDVQRWSPLVAGLLVVVPCMLVHVTRFIIGNMRASSGQVEGVCECCEIIIRQLCGPRPHFVGMLPMGRSICQHNVIETSPD